MKLYLITIIKLILAIICAVKFTDTYNILYLIAAMLFAVRWTFTFTEGTDIKKYYM